MVMEFTPTPLAADYVPAERMGEAQRIYPLNLYLCQGCGLVQILCDIDQEGPLIQENELTSVSLGMVEHFQKYADATVRLVDPPKDALVVDIGSNDGTLLKFYQGHGMKALGVEAAKVPGKAATDAGVETIVDFFSADLAQRIKEQHGQATLVTANRVIANVNDLTDMICGVRDLLDPNGLFVFETGRLVDLLDDLLFDTVYHEHIDYAAVKPLEMFFQRHHMELIDIQHVPVKGGSYRGIVQHVDGGRKASPAVAEMRAHEESLGINTGEPFKAFTAKIDTAKTALQDLVQQIKTEGKSIAGYGASIGSTTLIYHLGLGNALSFLVDDDTRHLNLFSPGFHLPVHPSEVIYEKNPDYIVVLAWRYTDPIIRKHQAFRDQGGKFIVPFPELNVV